MTSMSPSTGRTYTTNLLLAVLTTVVLETASLAVDSIYEHELTYIFGHEVLGKNGTVIPEPTPVATALVGYANWRYLLTSTITAAVLYHVHLFLEGLLPTRGSGSSKAYERQSVSKVTDDDPSLEDEVVRRLIAQGKIKRASVNWCNVTLKWTVINLIVSYLPRWIHALFSLKNGEIEAAYLMHFDLLFRPLFLSVFGILSPHSLATLVALIAAPVEYRIQCTALAGLFSSALIAIFVHWNMRWILQTGFMKPIIEQIVIQAEGSNPDGIPLITYHHEKRLD